MLVFMLFLMSFVSGLLGGLLAHLIVVRSPEAKRFFRTQTIWRHVPRDEAKASEQRQLTAKSMGDRTIVDPTRVPNTAHVRKARMRGRRMQ
jgi:hypothetical protein